MTIEQIEPQAKETREERVYNDVRNRIGDMLAEKAREISNPDESGLPELLKRAYFAVGELEEWIKDGNTLDDLNQMLSNGFLTYASDIREDPIADTLIADENPVHVSIVGPSFYRTHWDGVYVADVVDFMDQFEVRQLTFVGTNHLPEDFRNKPVQ